MLRSMRDLTPIYVGQNRVHHVGVILPRYGRNIVKYVQSHTR